MNGLPSAVFIASADAMPPLPGGYEFALGGDKVSARTAVEILPKVSALLLKHKVSAPAEIALAEYMCPRMGALARSFCKGDFGTVKCVRPAEALSGSAAYAKRPLVDFDTIQRRLAQCSKCPRHERHWCVGCTGAAAKLRAMMGGRGRRRPALPMDRFSGVCACAKAYEMVVCSVQYGDEPVWEDAPDECWRRTEDV